MDKERLEKLASAAPKASGGVRRKGKAKHHSKDSGSGWHSSSSARDAPPHSSSHREQQSTQKQSSPVPEEKRMLSTMKRVGASSLSDTDEITIVKDNEIMHFFQPQVHANASNTIFSITGIPSSKRLADVLPDMALGGAGEISGASAAVANANHSQHTLHSDAGMSGVETLSAAQHGSG